MSEQECNRNGHHILRVILASVNWVFLEKYKQGILASTPLHSGCIFAQKYKRERAGTGRGQGTKKRAPASLASHGSLSQVGAFAPSLLQGASWLLAPSPLTSPGLGKWHGKYFCLHALGFFDSILNFFRKHFMKTLSAMTRWYAINMIMVRSFFGTLTYSIWSLVCTSLVLHFSSSCKKCVLWRLRTLQATTCDRWGNVFGIGDNMWTSVSCIPTTKWLKILHTHYQVTLDLAYPLPSAYPLVAYPVTLDAHPAPRLTSRWLDWSVKVASEKQDDQQDGSK